ncbi:MAG: bifunctional alpha,alpha-trehalose-phosphate synthase (UDP-forming)/trehalose-phosphatase [Candidatus Atribacteria bacterium]|nr:bifunctional alpha,alpha-trehalose-phosphate synthase (UDP-forming)/trehalose-phosphatase [Candidatus Atribacteria bacterium]
MSRIVIVSNRLPVTVKKVKDKLTYQQSVGGLATGMSSFQKDYQCLWVGWPGISREQLSAEEKSDLFEKMEQMGNYAVLLSQSQIEDYYNGFSNKTIWSLFHCFTQFTVYDNHLWESYRQVNQIFCQTILDIIKPNDILWIHDYHLMLLPNLLRKRLPNLSIGFFLHIPFPPTEIFRLLPWRREILEGLMGADLIGFHTYDYVRNFLDSILRLRGYENSLGHVNYQNRMIKVDSFPMGIDFDRYFYSTDQEETKNEIQKIRQQVSHNKIIISVDRLDYTKGIPERLKAFSTFLEDNPEYWEKVTMILVAVPSRTDVPQYQNLKKQVDEMIGYINGKFGKLGWSPILYLYRSIPFHELAALYYTADIALITPLKDGMNLIAKEYIATKKDATGVLILSEMAGAGNEMSEALIVNPNNCTQISWAIKYALNMDDKEQLKRILSMQKRLKTYDVKKWSEDFKENLIKIKNTQKSLSAKFLSPKNRLKIIKKYKQSNQRLFLIDYDGTLAPKYYKFKQYEPSPEIIHTINLLIHDPKNKVVIVSGREKNLLEEWFQSTQVDLIAEHGAWLKKDSNEWKTIEPLKKEWKEQIKPILEVYTNRTPGSFIQEKEYSLVWHYVNTDPTFGRTRAMELMDSLTYLTSNLNLEVIHGEKVIEIKTTGINKGLAAYQWISEKNWDFILAIGDDWSDEPTFSHLPASAYSIKVGPGISTSKYNIQSSTEVRAFLKELALKYKSTKQMD